jgi:ParB family chromosome partitioning protein
MTTKNIKISDIQLYSTNDRFIPTDEADAELAESIGKWGLRTPIQVADVDGKLYLIAGHRRLAAVKSLGLDKIEANVTKETHQGILTLRLIENVQRVDLSPLELAVAIGRLKEETGDTDEQLAERVGKSVSQVKKALMLTRLPEPLMDAVANDEISPSVAITYAAVDNEDYLQTLLHNAREYGVTHKAAQEHVRAYKGAVDALPEDVAPNAVDNYANSLEPVTGVCFLTHEKVLMSNLTTVFIRSDLERMMDGIFKDGIPEL